MCLSNVCVCLQIIFHLSDEENYALDATDTFLYREAVPMKKTDMKREFREEMWFMSVRVRCTDAGAFANHRTFTRQRLLWFSGCKKMGLRVLKHSPLQRLWASVRHWKFEHMIHNATKHITFMTHFLFFCFRRTNETHWRKKNETETERRKMLLLFFLSESVVFTMTPRVALNRSKEYTNFANSPLRPFGPNPFVWRCARYVWTSKKKKRKKWTQIKIRSTMMTEPERCSNDNFGAVTPTVQRTQRTDQFSIEMNTVFLFRVI